MPTDLRPAETPVDHASIYRTLAESAPAVLAVFDGERRFEWLNESWNRHLGWSVDALRGTWLIDLVHPDDAVRFTTRLTSDGGAEASPFERTRLQHREGGWRWIDWFVAPMATGLFYAREVTDVIASEQLLARRAELMTLAESVSGVGHWSLDVRTEQIFWSPQVYHIHGLDASTHVPTLSNAVQAYHPDDRAPVAQMLAQAISQGAPFEFELRIVRPHGDVRNVLSRGRCERDPISGATATLFGTFLDVTERDRRREHMAREQRLLTTGLLAAGVGHELKNPLTFVSANLELVDEELRHMAGAAPSADMRAVLEMLADSRQGIERIKQIIRGLRSFAREDAAPGAVDLAAAVRLAVSMSAPQLRSRASCVIKIGETPLVQADDARLSQVLVNLISNAAQAFPTADVEHNQITIRTECPSNDRVDVLITDNGPGIPASVLPHIFEPFYSTKPPSDGSGLGLAISQSIMQAFGGELTCDTRIGEGTTFRVGLRPAPDIQDTPLPGAEAGERAAMLGHIVIIEDEAPLARAIQRVLQREMTVTVFSDARDALQFLERTHDVDVILSDILMPHLSGIELFDALRRTRPELAERVVFMSGGFVRTEVQAFLDSIDNERLEKPFDFAQLRAMARRAVARGAPRVAH